MRAFFDRIWWCAFCRKYVSDLTSGELRSLADLLEHETLPCDPFTLLSLEALGYVVDLDTGAIFTERNEPVGNVNDLTPLLGNSSGDMPPMLTLIGVLRMPGVLLVNNEKLLHWSEAEKAYILQDYSTNMLLEFSACAPALKLFVGGEQNDA